MVSNINLIVILSQQTQKTQTSTTIPDQSEPGSNGIGGMTSYPRVHTKLVVIFFF